MSQPQPKSPTWAYYVGAAIGVIAAAIVVVGVFLALGGVVWLAWTASGLASALGAPSLSWGAASGVVVLLWAGGVFIAVGAGMFLNLRDKVKR